MNIKRKKVIVAMSGGVDSSVAAFLLKKQGYEVAGVFMKFWKEKRDTNIRIHANDANKYEENTCCSEESEASARAVADKLNMPFYVIDVSREFKKAVVDYFLAEYQAGRTPNPCVVCNREIKFGLMLKKMKELGGDYLATGHYVRKSEIRNPKSETNSKSKIKNPKQTSYFKLLKAKDKKKDQSYFLWTLTQEKLKHLLFPVGEYMKDEIRKIAEKNNLPYHKKESFDICFAGGEVSGFLKRHLKIQAGDIILPNGQVIGQHQGLPLYTIGQRQGIGLSGGPFYVAGYNLDKNQLVVVSDIKDPMLLKKELKINTVNWIAPHPNPLPSEGAREKLGNINILTAKIRYGAKEVKVDKIEKLSNYEYKVIFKEPVWAATPGQSAVFYDKNELKRGGIIEM